MMTRRRRAASMGDSWTLSRKYPKNRRTYSEGRSFLLFLVFWHHSPDPGRFLIGEPLFGRRVSHHIRRERLALRSRPWILLLKVALLMAVVLVPEGTGEAVVERKPRDEGEGEGRSLTMGTLQVGSKVTGARCQQCSKQCPQADKTAGWSWGCGFG